MYLVGFMGVGKSVVGRLLAARSGRRFIDLDEEISRKTGLPVTEIFGTAGEPAFRLMEAKALGRVCRSRGLVVATGGGVVLEPRNVDLMLCTGLVVWLQASVETILARLVGDDSRPLLAAGWIGGGDRRERVARLLEERLPLYARAGLAIATDDLDPEDVAARVAREVDHDG